MAVRVLPERDVVRCVAYVAAETGDADSCPEVCDVHPDGRSYNVVDGIRRPRCRDSLASSDLPRYDRCPDTGEGSATATRMLPQRNRLFSDSARPSYLQVAHVPST